MTREELKAHCIRQVEQCKRWAELKGEEPSGKVYEEHKLILELLEQEPCEVSQGLVKDSQGFSQEPCEDAISRQAVLDAMCNLCNTGENLQENPWRDNPHIDAITDEIDKLPSVTPQPKTGYWTRELIRNEKGGCIGAKRICSRCGKDNKHDEYMDYCPNCGAEMFQSQESEGEK